MPLAWDVGLDSTDAAARAVAASMRETWLSFISGGDPCATDLPTWPQYREGDRSTVHFDSPIRVARETADAPAALWGGVDWVPGTWWPLVEEFATA